MAIDKKVATDKFNEEVKKQVAMAILVIDRKLEDLIHGSSLTIMYKDLNLPEINHAVFKAVSTGILMEYEEHGWSVGLHDEDKPSKMYFSFS